MKRGQSSITALGIAVIRAMEAKKSPHDRICDDPYAREFVPTWLYYLVKFFIVTGIAEWRGRAGIGEFIVARVRHIDDYLNEQIEEGIDQLVILGAGYDSRAYRFEQLRGKVKVFEVDHPTTQEVKKAKLEKIFGAVPDYVNYVPLDFEQETLDERLPQSGYDEGLRTLFIWEGVTEYLDAGSVDATLSFVSKKSGPGSSIIFDYIHKSLLDGTEKHGEVSIMRRNRFISGEELTFGIEEGGIEEFLKARGFGPVKNVSRKELEEAYFTGKNKERRVASGYSIATAYVKVG